jgi:hypothetical protein
MERDSRRWKQIWTLLGDHVLAAVMSLIDPHALHGLAALHALPVRGHGSHTIPKLQEQQANYGHDKK